MKQHSARFTALLFTLTAVAIGACGTTARLTPVDAGPAPIVDAAKEAAPVVDAGLTCSDASAKDLPVPDAAVADSGVSTGTCFSCLQASCGTQLETCNANCECRGAILAFLSCAPTASDPQAAQACAIQAFTAVSGEASELGTAIGLCANRACRKECIPAALQDGGADLDASDSGDADTGM
jgi:hypothetical protein